MGAETGEMTETIAAPVDTIVDALVDFDTHARWQSLITASRVLERDDAGRGVLVEEQFDVKVRRVRIVARYHYDLPASLGWERVEGDVRMLRCEYYFEPRADGRTTVRVELAFDIGFYVPGAVKRVIRDQALRSSLKELKRHVESRTG